jgi:hypothetical protein
LVAVGVAAGPWLAMTLVTALVVLFRSISLSSSTSSQRRNRRGAKWYDAPLDVISAPWHFLVSLPLSLLLIAWGWMLAACVALLLLVVGIDDIPLLVVAGFVFGVSVWTGPGSSRVRQPVTSIGRPLGESVLPWAIAVVVLLGLCALMLAGALDSGIEWAPGNAAPWGGTSWLSHLNR